MITVLHFKCTYEPTSETAAYRIVEKGDSVILRFSNIFFHGRRRAGAYVFTPAQNKGKVFDVYLRETDKFAITTAIEAFTYCGRTGYNSPPNFTKKVARVVIDDKGDMFIALVTECPDIEGYTNIEVDQNTESVSGALKAASEWFAKLYDKTGIKYRLIKNVDNYASLSYLEAQVDVLTKIVLAMASENSEAAAKYLPVLETADEYSVLNIKTLDAAKAEFTEKKAAFRELQKKYYKELEDSEKS